ncbi:MAG: hypothetical protein EOL91_11320 [Actinobacteria bacterium]|nr:hypothetical protein [Actinomycetota bacterium]
MLNFIDTRQRVEFISEYDKTEPKTVFILKPISGIDRINSFEGNQYSAKKTISNALVEIKNCGDLSKDEVIESISLDVINELFSKINEMSEVDADGKKK